MKTNTSTLLVGMNVTYDKLLTIEYTKAYDHPYDDHTTFKYDPLTGNKLWNQTLKLGSIFDGYVGNVVDIADLQFPSLTGDYDVFAFVKEFDSSKDVESNLQNIDFYICVKKFILHNCSSQDQTYLANIAPYALLQTVSSEIDAFKTQMQVFGIWDESSFGMFNGNFYFSSPF